MSDKKFQEQLDADLEALLAKYPHMQFSLQAVAVEEGTEFITVTTLVSDSLIVGVCVKALMDNFMPDGKSVSTKEPTH